MQLGGLGSSYNVLLTATFNARGQRLSLAANVGGTLGTGGSVSGGTPDFLNSYTYGREKGISPISWGIVDKVARIW